MKMNRVERFIVNTPVTTFLHGRILLNKALRHARPIRGELLEVGCGQGATTEILIRRFPDSKITAIDYDPAQVERARRRVRERARVEQGDVTDLRFADATFDTVVELNVLHHVKDPLAALYEIRRVLEPGGQFVFTDYTSHFFRGPTAKVFPPETRFTADAFVGMVQQAGLCVSGREGKWVVRGAATRPVT